jgi:hypothetical protein
MEARDHKKPQKAPSRSSSMQDNPKSCGSGREELEIGEREEILEGNDDQEEALRALEAYAAFQVTLLQHIADNPTFYDPQSQLMPQKSSKMTRPWLGRLPENSILGSDPGSV